MVRSIIVIAMIILALVFILRIYVVPAIVGKVRNKKDSLKKLFTKYTIDNFSEEILKNSYYFLDKPLKLIRVESDSKKLVESGKMVLKTDSIKREILITEDIRGKLLEINGDIVKIQFDKDEECSLLFRWNEERFLLKTDENIVVYNKCEYKPSKYPCIMYKLVEKGSHKTIKNKAKGAW